MTKKFKVNGIKNIILEKISEKVFSTAKSSFSQISIKEQYILFSIIMSIFEKFPEKFRIFIIENNLSNFGMIRDMDVIPYWYQKSVNDIQPKTIYDAKMITEEEILNGINYFRF